MGVSPIAAPHSAVAALLALAVRGGRFLHGKEATAMMPASTKASWMARCRSAEQPPPDIISRKQRRISSGVGLARLPPSEMVTVLASCWFWGRPTADS